MHDIITFDTESRPQKPRKILLLQGLVGPFFRRIAMALRRQGVDVQKINFNGGDSFFWRFTEGGTDYTGTEAAWPQFLQRTLLRDNITDVLLFGDCRPLHRAAIPVCRAMGVTVWVFDEGYIRPDWVTFEQNGINGYSQLPRDPAYYLAQANALPPLPAHAPVAFSFRRRSFEAVLYDTANIAWRWRFPHWRNHRPWGPLREGLGWLRRLSGRREAVARAAALLFKLESDRAAYMLLPLQLSSDAQIRFHSPYASMKEAVEEVIKSFASHAPPQLRLLVKEHPLDNGLSDWRQMISALAHQHNVAGRIDYVEDGDIALIVRSARGLVTVNSTTGTLALACGVPVIALGHAVYDMPGITHQAGLAAFWNAPVAPDAKTFAAFRCVLIDRCLLPGGFFSDAALDLTVDGVVKRLMASQPAESIFLDFDEVIFSARHASMPQLAHIA